MHGKAEFYQEQLLSSRCCGSSSETPPPNVQLHSYNSETSAIASDHLFKQAHFSGTGPLSPMGQHNFYLIQTTTSSLNRSSGILGTETHQRLSKRKGFADVELEFSRDGPFLQTERLRNLKTVYVLSLTPYGLHFLVKKMASSFLWF